MDRVPESGRAAQIAQLEHGAQRDAIRGSDCQATSGMRVQ
jgi:hypothetical protein